MSEKNLDGEVRYEILGHIMQITFDRVEKRNAFTPKMYEELSDAYTLLDQDKNLRVGVLCFEGEHSTSGLDLQKFSSKLGNIEGILKSGNIDPFSLKNKCRKPIVVAVQGTTFTVGVELMLAADITIASDDCVFSQMEPQRGIMAFGGAAIRYVERAGWGNAMYHLLIAGKFDAQTALSHGLVQEVVPKGQQIDRAMTLAQKIAKNAPLAVQATKETARIYTESGEQTAINTFGDTLKKLATSKDVMEGMAAMMQKREPVFKGE